MCLWLHIADDKKYKNVVEPAIFFFVAGMAATVVYTINPAISADHFWASRRWVSINYPFLFMYAAVAIVWLYKTPAFKFAGKVAACAATVCTVIYMAWQCRLFAFTTMMSDSDAGLSAIAAALPDDEPTFTSDGVIASVLKYVYKKPVYLFRGKFNSSLENYHTDNNISVDADALRDYISKKGSISVVGNTLFYGMYFDSETILTQSFDGVYPLETAGEYPTILRETYDDISVGRVTYNENGTSKQLIEAMALDTGCEISNGKVEIPQEFTGYALWGPYITLPEGKYKVTFTFADENAVGEGYADVSAELGAEELAHEEINSDSVSMVFEVAKPTDYMEFRLIKESEESAWTVTSVLLEILE